MGPGAERLAWNTADLAHIGNAPEVWELSTFWDLPDGTTMATLERLSGGRMVTTDTPVANLQRITGVSRELSA
jgi:hypothetical protein